MNADFPTWEPHPGVWLMVVALVLLGRYAVRVVGPKVVRDSSVTTRREVACFAAGLLVLWLASDWPLHDVGEGYLYSAHMVQHLLLTMVVAPLFLLATPEWLLRLVIGDGWFAGHVLRRLTHPIVAGVLFNAVFVLTHWQPVVNGSVRSGPIHLGVHVLVVGTALLMWVPVVAPMKELRLGPPGQMLYLFCQSIVPTVPSGWLIFADKVVYDVYDTPARLFGISAITDQQIAGVLMKLGAGVYLWAIILTLFFRWAATEQAERSSAVRVSSAGVTNGQAEPRAAVSQKLGEP